MTHHVTRQLNLLIDGRLERQDALKAMAHLAECESCTDEWDALRRDREALQTSGSGIDMRFAQRLLDRERIAVIAQAEPRRHAKAANCVRPHVLRGSLLVASGAIGILTILYMLGEPKEIPLSTLIAGNSVSETTVQMVSMDDAEETAALVASGHPEWAGSELTPLGTTILEDDGIRVSRTTVRMGENELIVTERRGRLPRDIAEVLEQSAQGDRTVFLFDGDGAGILFESGQMVVTIGCSCPKEILVGVAQGFPEERSPGVLSRLGDGMGELADVVTGG
jgi:hypothetical protein